MRHRIAPCWVREIWKVGGGRGVPSRLLGLDGWDLWTIRSATFAPSRKEFVSSSLKYPEDSLQCGLELLDSSKARLALLDKFNAIETCLSAIRPTLNVAKLWHWDLRSANIFVDGSEITSLIDWQDCWIGPLFMQEKRPRIIDHMGEIMLRPPDHYETLEDGDGKAKLGQQVESLWFSGTMANPVLQAVYDLPLARPRMHTISFASDISTTDQTIPFRECVLKLYRHWAELNTPDPCPIKFDKEEIEPYSRKSDGSNEEADMWGRLERFVDRDGCVAAKIYDDARFKRSERLD